MAGSGDDVGVIANFFNEPLDGYVLGFPFPGHQHQETTFLIAIGKVTVRLFRDTRAVTQKQFKGTVMGFGFKPQYRLHPLVL
jgi:hypothetical protein